jgi:hypothetical protein
LPAPASARSFASLRGFARGTARADYQDMATVETIVAFALIFATMSRIFVTPKP